MKPSFFALKPTAAQCKVLYESQAVIVTSKQGEMSLNCLRTASMNARLIHKRRFNSSQANFRFEAVLLQLIHMTIGNI